MLLKLWYAQKNATRGFVFTGTSDAPSDYIASPDAEIEVGTFDLTEASALVFVNAQAILNDVGANGFKVVTPNWMTKTQITQAVIRGEYTHALDQELPTLGVLTDGQNIETGDLLQLHHMQDSSAQSVIFGVLNNTCWVIAPAEYDQYIW